MYNSTPELQWLAHLIDWTRNREQYISRLKNTSVVFPGSEEPLQKWAAQFSRLRKKAEQQRADNRRDWSVVISPAARGLLREAQHLHRNFIRFLEENLIPQRLETDYRPVPPGKHVLSPLPYGYDALEPHIDEQTMRLHHTKHHQSYVDGLNQAEQEMQKARESGDFSLIRHWEREAAFHGSGHYLHTIFWNNMSPRGGGHPTGAIAREIEQTFGGFDKFKRHFTEAADKAEGVGWAILAWVPRSHRTEILQAEKHQFLTQQDQIPLLVLDVWEHAYYLKYKNNRRDYINAWWNVVNWDDVNSRFERARHLRWEPF